MKDEDVPVGVKDVWKLILHMLGQGFDVSKVVTIGIELALRGEGSNDRMVWPKDSPCAGIRDILIGEFPLWKGGEEVGDSLLGSPIKGEAIWITIEDAAIDGIVLIGRKVNIAGVNGCSGT